jgi:hypothetical protein
MTEKLHWLVLVLSSVAVQLTVVVPFWNSEPDGGWQLMVTDLSQLSVAVTVNETLALHMPGSVFAVTG